MVETQFTRECERKRMDCWRERDGLDVIKRIGTRKAQLTDVTASKLLYVLVDALRRCPTLPSLIRLRPLLPCRFLRSDKAMVEDALQLGEMSSSSHSDSVEVLSEATESENESSSTQDWPPLYITWSSDSDSDSEEVIPAVTESEAVRLLAARVPPELFDNILSYVNVDRVSQRVGGICSLIGLWRSNLTRTRRYSDDTSSEG
ncbi:hypothetical protein BC629DRAFT_1737946, partial [Irpex lacteus]